MATKKVWFITGGGRGMGVEFAKAALTAGDAVVATGRDPSAVSDAVGKVDDLLGLFAIRDHRYTHRNDLPRIQARLCCLQSQQGLDQHAGAGQ